ncbi:MAG: hypothetical protein GY926_21310 [bacterium]|nr:hypothetical protein [bacterium]
MDFDADVWNRVRRARAQLERQIFDHPDVTLIDIGLARSPVGEDTDPPDELVLRVHLRGFEAGSAAREQHADFPDSINGFRVVLEPGNYQLD